MSQLTDLIQQMGPQAVADAIRDDATFKVFNLMWSDPQEITPVVNRMGWQTLEELQLWLNQTNAAIGKTADFEALVDPPAPVALDGMAKTPWHPLHVAIHATGLLASDCLLHNSDAEYFLPTKAQWDAIAAACPAKRRKHTGTDLLDCDDFVSIARGWLASKGLGNTANAMTATRHFWGNTIQGGHAVILVWDNTLTPWQWEPQTGVLYPAGFAKLGGNFLANRVEYARIFA